MSPTGLHINKAALCVIIGLLGGIVLWYKFLSGPSSATLNELTIEGVHSAVSKTPVQMTIPKLQTIKIKELVVSYREVIPEKSKFDILFLHGAAFSSETWVNKPLMSLQTMQQLGYRAIALDLPGKGSSTGIKEMDKGEYLESVILALKLDRPVIISPSMSGAYSIKFLFSEPASVLSRARGFVPVAPVDTKEYEANFKESQIPSLIVYGADDKDLGLESLKHLQSLPKKTVTPIEGAGHACYAEKPTEFHQALKTFLDTLS